jgi:hypothetical protein
MTGKVSFECCCHDQTNGDPAAALAVNRDGCCTVTHLSAPWNWQQIATQPTLVALPAKMAVTPSAKTAFGRDVGDATASIAVESPPIWRLAARI